MKQRMHSEIQERNKVLVDRTHTGMLCSHCDISMYKLKITRDKWCKLNFQGHAKISNKYQSQITYLQFLPGASHHHNDQC